ncbi:MAG: hypothetical protein QGG67_15385 [Gammaproteobacteria bacterium]|jgi:hypothetical protein|nr:hypothetical protein [Chromatiales bacterium]MDP6097346.1 hypothetical protein [Gammaproteobacteria bacterium]HJP04360.1 hypothetical protein [Gammaproteobacteria bacterium]
MSVNPILSLAHSGAGLLLLALAITSVLIAVLIAVKPATDPANIVLVKTANVVGLIEIIVAVTISLTGLTAAFMESLPLSQQWLWLSLVIMVFYISAHIWVTKPARMAVAIGGSEVKSGMQVILQIGHVLLLLPAYALMILKPI